MNTIKLENCEHSLALLNVDMSASQFDEVEAKNSQLNQVNFAGSALTKVNLDDSSLEQVSCQNSQLKRVNLAGSSLSEANLHNFAIRSCNYEGMSIEGIPVFALVAAYQQQAAR